MIKHKRFVPGVRTLALKIFLVTATLIPIVPGPGIAASTAVNSAERLTIAGRQRMLAQGMAAKLCLIEQGVNPLASQGELYVMWNIFTWYNAGIRYGNPVLDVTTEVDPRVKKAWANLDTQWNVLKALHEKQLDRKSLTEDDFSKAMAKTQQVTEEASKLVASLRGAYADQLGSQGFGQALLIDLYERQRMLAHKITKQICLTTRGQNSEADLASLQEQIDIFALSLEAFQNGRPDVGVPPPPSEEIAVRLVAAQGFWEPMQPLVRGVAKGQSLSKHRLGRLALAMDGFIVEMTAAMNALTAK